MTCPICGKATSQDYRPFCSRRCADVDLGRWLTESYRIPASGDEADEADDTPPEPSPVNGPH